jgi:hypothetical protein
MPLLGVKNAIGRSSLSIAEMLRQFHLGAGGSGMNIPQEERSAAAELLRRTLYSPGNEELLSNLKASAKEVLAVIESADITLSTGTESDGLWIARVYEALAGATEAPPTPQQLEIEQALLEMERTDLAAIGKAFVETLLPDLPITLTRFSEFFANAPRVGAEEVALLSNEPDVRAAFPNSADLALFGIRPLSVFYASEAVANLFDRLLRYGLIEESDLFLSSKESDNYAPLLAKRNLDVSIDREIADMTDCSVQTSAILLKWLIAVSEYKPFVFGGFEAELKRGGVLLKRYRKTFANLYERWAVSYAID